MFISTFLARHGLNAVGEPVAKLQTLNRQRAGSGLQDFHRTLVERERERKARERERS